MSITTTDHVEACEAVLRADIAKNIELNIMPSAVKVAETLLSRGLELKDAYHELHIKLGPNQQALEIFFDRLLCTAAYWNPKRLANARDARARLDELNRDIAKKAGELAALLEKRSGFNGRDGFQSGQGAW